MLHTVIEREDYHMKTKVLGIMVVTGVCAVIVAGLILPAPWLARESIFEFASREPQDDEVGEPGAPPMDDPVMPTDKPQGQGGAAEGP